MKEGAKALLGLLLAVLLLAWVFRDTDPRELRRALAGASLGMLALGGMLNLGHNVFRVWRWGALLAPVRRDMPFRPMFAAVIVGYLTTWLVPGRLGEIVRPALLSARENVPLGPCLGTVVTDRILDGMTIVFLFAVGTLVTQLPGDAAPHVDAIRASALLLTVGIAVVLAALVAASTAKERLSAWLAGRSRAIRWLGRTVLSVARGTEAMRRPALLLRIVALSVAAWLTIALGTWIGIVAAGVDVPFGAVLILLPVLALGVALPTPGGAGGYHAAMVFGLTRIFDAPRDLAVAAGILMHLAVTLPVIVLGLLLLRTERIAWGDMMAAARQVRGLGSTS
jgi:uncharacterized protein (TIRG00374 family)